jgi:Arc/MetJ-type ribon-helix-helix transcriptional regulator
MNTTTAGIQDSGDAIKVALPANLIAQIDAQVGGAFTDRDDFIRSAVRYYLEHIRETQGAALQDIG